MKRLLHAVDDRWWDVHDSWPDSPLGDWQPRPKDNGASDPGVIEPAGSLADRIRVLDLAELLSSEPEPPSWVWHPYLERGTLTLLHGDGGLGKSLIAPGLACAVMRGEPFLGWPTRKGAVVYVDAENPIREIHRRLAGFDVGPEERRLHYIRADAPILGDLETPELLRELAAEAMLLILDSQRGLWPGDEYDLKAVRVMYWQLRRLAEATDVGILLLHHDRKAGGYSGSSDLNANVDSRIHLRRPLPERRGAAFSSTPATSSTSARAPGRPSDSSRGRESAALNPKVVSAVRHIREQGTVRTWQLAGAMGVSERTVRRWRDDLAALGIKSDGEGHFWPAEGGRT